MKFQAPAGVTYEDLVMNARKELQAGSPGAYKLFLLCMCAEFIEPKHGSGGTVYVDPALMKELLSFRDDGQEGFVVQSHLEWKAVDVAGK